MQTIVAMMTVKSERRRKERKRPLSLVYVELAAGNGGMMRDLSEEGFAVRAMMPLRNSEKTPFQFSLDESTKITGAGQICWVKDDGKLVGVRFEEISPVALEQIRRWLREVDRRSKAGKKPAEAPQVPAPTLEDFREELRSSPAHPPRPAKETIPRPAPVAESVPTVPVSAAPPVKTESVPVTPMNVASPVILEGPVILERSVVIAAEPTPPARQESVPAAPAIPPTPPIPSSSHGSEVGEAPPSPAIHTGTVSAPPALPASPVSSHIHVPAETPPPVIAHTENVPAAPSIALPRLSLPGSPVAEPHPPLAAHPETVPGPPPMTPLPISFESKVATPAAVPPQPHSETVPVAPAHPTPVAHTDSVWEKLMLPTAPSASEGAAAVPAVPVSEREKKEGPPLPDISTILLQPTMVRKISEPIEAPPEAPALEPLPLLEEKRPAKGRARIENFTLARAISIMVLLVLLVGGYVYHREVGLGLIWLGQKIAGTEQPEERKTALMENPALPPASARQTGTAAASSNPVVTIQSNPSSSSENQEPRSAANMNELLPVTPLGGSTGAPGTMIDQEAGQAEYQQALQLLRGKNREANLQEAVRLLWVSVEKGNPGAELTLAELFWRGQGVSKSCDQTRILLSAAARKGNAEARELLKQFEREGCE